MQDPKGPRGTPTSHLYVGAKSEIRYLDLAVVAEQDVVGLDVSVHQAQAVEVGQSGQELLEL